MNGAGKTATTILSAQGKTGPVPRLDAAGNSNVSALMPKTTRAGMQSKKGSAPFAEWLLRVDRVLLIVSL